MFNFDKSVLDWLILSFGILVSIGIIFLRVKESKRNVSAKSLLIPPLGMSTGFIMFLCPLAKISWEWAVLALLAGSLLLSPLLILNSGLTVDEEKNIRMKPSPAFAVVFVIIIVARLFLRDWIEQHLSWLQTGSICFLLAFGMIVPWRLTLYRHYYKIRAQKSN